MATRDFRSQQLRTTQIIASGSDTTSKPSLLIYSSSAASDDQGGLSPALLSGAGEDNWLFISGSTQVSDGEQVLFGGNIAVSGSVSGSHFAALPGQSLTLTSDNNMKFRVDYDDATDGVSQSSIFQFVNGANTEIVNIDEVGNLQIDGDLTVDGGDAHIIAGQDTSAQLFMKADAGDDAGDEWRIKASGTDTFAIGNDKASAGNYIDLLTITGDATERNSNVATAGTLQVGGNIIKASDGGNTITMDNEDNVQIAGDLRIDGNHPTGASVIRNSQDEAVITIDREQDTFLSGTLTIPSSIIHDGDSDTLITFDTNEVTIQSGAARTTEFGSTRVSINKDYQDQDVEIRGDTTNTRIIHTIASQDSVHFLFNEVGDASDIPEHDVNFKVHGISGNKNTVGTRGTALFVGDVVVSGTLYAEKQVVEVDHSQVGNLVLTGAIHLDDSGAGYGSTLAVPAGDGAIYVSTGSLYAKLAEHPGGATTEVLIGQNYIAGNGIESYTVNPNTTFHLDVGGLSGSLTSSAGEGSWTGFEKPESHGTGMLFHEDVFAVGSNERFDGRYMLFNKAGVTAAVQTKATPVAGTDAGFLTTEGFGYIQPYQSNCYTLEDADGVTIRFDNITTLDGPGHGTAGIPDADEAVYLYFQIEATGIDDGSADKLIIYGVDANGLTNDNTPTAQDETARLDWEIDILDVDSYGATWRQLHTTSNSMLISIRGDHLNSKVTGDVNGVKRWVRAKAVTSSESITILRGFFFTVTGNAGESFKIANPIVVFESKRETKKIAMQDFLSQSAGPGILNAGRLSYQTDNRIVAHLTGSEFNGTVGVTGSLGVSGDMTLAPNNKLYFNNRLSDSFLRYNSGGDGSLQMINNETGGDIALNAGSATGKVTISAAGETNNLLLDAGHTIWNTESGNIDVTWNTETASPFIMDGADGSVVLGHQSTDYNTLAAEVPGYEKDVLVMLSGSLSAKDNAASRGVILAGGDFVVSGSNYMMAGARLTGSLDVNGIAQVTGSIQVIDTDPNQLKVSRDADEYLQFSVEEHGSNTKTIIEAYQGDSAGGQQASLTFRSNFRGSARDVLTLAARGAGTSTLSGSLIFRNDDATDDGYIEIGQTGNGGPDVISVYRAKDSDFTEPKFNLLRARGSNAAPTVVQDGDTLGDIGFWGHDGADYELAAKISAKVSGTPADDTTDMPGMLVFSTTPDGSDSPLDRMSITPLGLVGIGTTDPGTRLQVEHTQPYVTLKNTTAENTDGGAESKIIFEDHSNASLAEIEAAHDGNADDTKGRFRFKVNTGSGLVNALTISSDQNVQTGGDLTVGGGDIRGPNDGSLTIKSDTDLIFKIDNDGDGTETFQFQNGSGNEVASLDESGNLQVDGTVSAGGTATVTAANDADAKIELKADNSDDAGDDWTITANADQTFTIGNDIASAGTAVSHVVITPHATVANSTFEVKGKLKVGSNTIQNADGESTLILDGDQRVGIGGIAPSYMLDVNGDVRIRGNDIRDNSGQPALSFDGSANTLVRGTMSGPSGANLTLSGSSNPFFQLAVTGAIGATQGMYISSDKRLYFNDHNGDQFISGNGAILTIDGDNFVDILGDSEIGLKAGTPASDDNHFQVSTTATTVNAGRINADFFVNTDNRFGTIMVDGADETIILGAETFTAGAAASTLLNKGYGNDVKILLSGSIGTKDTNNRGIVLVPGDIVVSGSYFNGAGARIDLQSVIENGSFTTTPQAQGTNSVAVGNDAQAGNIGGSAVPGAFAIGNKTRAKGQNSLALGSSTAGNTAQGTSAAVLGGEQNNATGDYSVVVGGQTNTAAGDYAVSMGDTVNVTADRAIGIGDNSTVSAARAISIGDGNTVNSTRSIALGASLSVPEANTVAIGNSTSNAKIALSGSVEAFGDLKVPEYIKHSGDEDTFIRLRENQVQLTAGNTNVFNFAAAENTISLNGDNAAVNTVINTANKLALAISNATDQVLILSGGHSSSPNMGTTTLDTNFFVSGSVGSKDSATVRGTAVFGGDVHISGALSGPAAYTLTDNDVKVFREGTTLKFKDGDNAGRTLSELASTPASTDFFFGVHGDSSNPSKLKATGSVAFAGADDNFVDGLLAKGVGQDVFVYFSGSIGSRAGHNTAGANQFKTDGRGVTLFGGDSVFSGSATYLNEVSFNDVTAAGSFIAGGNTIKNSNSDTSIKFNSSNANVLFGAASIVGSTVAKSQVDIRLDDNTVFADGTDGNTFANYNLALRNHSTTNNAFVGIAFDVQDEDNDDDAIGASITALRDASANSSQHKANLLFNTNPGADDDLTTRMIIDHTGSVGIGRTNPNGRLHVDGGDFIVAANAGSSDADAKAHALAVDYSTGRVGIHGELGNIPDKFSVIGDGTASAGAGGNNSLSVNVYNNGGQADIILRKARGTLAAPGAVAQNEILGGLYFEGLDGNNAGDTGGQFRHVAAIKGTMDQATDPGSSDMPGNLRFFTTPGDSVNLAEAFRINQAQQSIFGPSGVFVGNHSDRVIARNAWNKGNTPEAQLGLYNGNSKKLAFIIDPDGDVGIALAATSDKITISGSLEVQEDLILSDGTVFSVGTDVNGTDRKLTFGHGNVKTVIGIDDSQDRFAIHTGTDFAASNDIELDASGNVTIGNGNLIIDGGELRGTPSGQLKLYADTNVCINIDVDNSGTDALFKVQTNSQTTKFEIDEAGNVQMDGNLRVDGNVIQNSQGETTITLETDQDVAIANNLMIGGNIIKASDGGSTITMDTSDNVTIGNDLTVGGNVIRASDGGATITMDTDDNVTIAGDLTVSGGDITGPTDGQLKLKADLGVIIELDDDNDGAQSFKVRNGANTDVLEVSETGNLQMDGDLSVDGGDVTITSTSSHATLSMVAHQNGSPIIYMRGDAGDDNGDSWRVFGNSAVFSIDNDINGGSFVSHFKIQQNATVTASTTTIGGTLQVGGNVIKASDGGSTITMDTSDNVTIAGDLTVSGGELFVNDTNARAEAYLTRNDTNGLAQNEEIGILSFRGRENSGTIHQFGGVVMKAAEDFEQGSKHGSTLQFWTTANGNNSNTLAMEVFGNNDVDVKGNLQVSGNAIKDSGGNTIVSSNGSGAGTFAGNATTATTATNANKIDVNNRGSSVNNTTTDHRICFVDASGTGHEQLYVDNNKLLEWVPYTGVMKIGDPTVPSGMEKGLHIRVANDDDGGSGILLEQHNDANDIWNINRSQTQLNFARTTNGSSFTRLAYIHGTSDVGQLTFTGQHRSRSDESLMADEHVGKIVVSKGVYSNLNGATKPEINEALPDVELASSRNNKKVYGVISSAEDSESSQRHFELGAFVSVFEKEEGDNRLIINSVGEGGIWVSNINGNLENGDYITTCEIPGIGMKQDDDLLHNYTVAKITQDCNFRLNAKNYDVIEFEHEGKTYRKAFVGCTYHCG